MGEYFRFYVFGALDESFRHLEITSFLASLCKVCSIIQTRLVPPNVNLNVPNPKIKWNEYCLKVPAEITPIQPRHPSGRFLVSVNSSGIGGSNAHVVVESFPSPTDDATMERLPVLVMAGGLSSRSTSVVGETLAGLLSSHKNPYRISAAYGRRSLQMTWRSFAIFGSETPMEFSRPRFVSRKRAPLVFVLSGQGPQHINSEYL